MAYTLGLDYGTNSVRCVVGDCKNGKELSACVYPYKNGELGILLDPKDHNVARQHPADYLKGLKVTVKGAIKAAQKARKKFDPNKIIGIGVDTTGSTPIPIDAEGSPLAMQKALKHNLNAYVWLWKDHTGHAEAAEITALAERDRPHYLAKCGGTYSSEWFFSKVLHCLRTDPDIYEAAYTWVEHADWIPAVLTGTDHPSQIKRGRCAAGHKAMFSDTWGGYPDRDFLKQLDPRLERLRDTLGDTTYTVSEPAGKLTKPWAKSLGLPVGIPVAIGAFDAHLGGVGSGIQPGTLVKIIGTSTCDMVVAENTTELPDIPGICGIVDGSILPGYFGLEAGQSAVGDIFLWYVNELKPNRQDHVALTRKADKLKPGQSGLLALDWNNGNRTILVDQRLTGLLLGQTLHTQPAEIFRALVEATAFGALTIINRFEEFGIKIDRVVNCGGISEKNDMIMQIYADVTNREMKISRSAQTCALGAAICGAVVAGKDAGGYDTYADAQAAMAGLKKKTFKPIAAHVEVYQKLYRLYQQLHDAFGVQGHTEDLSGVMKELLVIKEKALQA
jgi:L-ribulokinase